MFIVTRRAEMRRAESQALFLTIEAAGEQVPPEADAALAATVQPRILPARILGRSGETGQQTLVRGCERVCDAAIPHAQHSKRARRFLAEDVTRGCGCDAFAGEQNDSF